MTIKIGVSTLALVAGLYVAGQAVNYIFFSPPDTTQKVRNCAEKVIEDLKEEASRQSPRIKWAVCLLADNLWIVALATGVVMDNTKDRIEWNGMNLERLSFTICGVLCVCGILHVSRRIIVAIVPRYFSQKFEPSYHERLTGNE